jgi:hypothetical protein
MCSPERGVSFYLEEHTLRMVPRFHTDERA